MKVMYINLFEGCQEKERFNRVISFIKNKNPDFLGLSELNEWDKNNFAKLKEFQSKIGLHNVIFCASNQGYHLALFSKYQIENSIVQNKGFNTGIIKVISSVGKKRISIILTHLNARNEDLRLKEVNIIKKHFNPEENVILMGDLNSLSPLDTYDERKLLDKLKKIGLKKFGSRSLKKEVIKKLTKMGLIDAVKKFSNSFEYSVPTTYNKDEAHFAKLRLDYIFVTKSLSSLLKDARIIRNKETNRLSDHFPIIAEIDL